MMAYPASQGPSTLAPLADVGNNLYHASSLLSWGGAISYIVANQGMLANLYMANQGNSTYTGDECTDVAFGDPMDDIINAYRELALRMAIRFAADNGTDAFTQTVPYVSQSVQVQYAISRMNLIVAVMVSLAGPLAILPLFWGWWILGRKVSMSPLEIANAFYAGSTGGGYAHDHGWYYQTQPAAAADMFGPCSGNATADELAKTFGKGVHFAGTRVRYAVLPSGRLSISQATSTTSFSAPAGGIHRL